MGNRLEIFFLALEILGSERLIEGWWSWKGSADRTGLSLVIHKDEDDGRSALHEEIETSAMSETQVKAGHRGPVSVVQRCVLKALKSGVNALASGDSHEVTRDDCRQQPTAMLSHISQQYHYT